MELKNRNRNSCGRLNKRSSSILEESNKKSIIEGEYENEQFYF